MRKSECAKDVFSPVGELSDRIYNELHTAGCSSQVKERRSARAKTRFLGFTFADVLRNERPEKDNWDVKPSEEGLTCGRLVIVEGAGVGTSFPLTHEFNRIGREDNQEIQLDFGDTAVSRKNHASVVRYGRLGYIIRDGRNPNPVLLNGRPLDGEEVVKHGDLVRIGETTLRFMEASAEAVRTP